MSFNVLLTFLASVLIAMLCLCIFVIIILAIRNYMQGGQYKKPTLIENKVVIVTGANTGIGKETAIDLAKRGGKIYIACRDVIKGNNAKMEIIEKSGSMNVHCLELDLASLESIREFSKKFHKIETQLDILINNAGVMACSKSYTADGFEMHMGVNFLGHFFLTNLLLDLLKAAPQSRIVNVSSLFHIVGFIWKSNLFGERFYFRWHAYAASKLANILFTRELAVRLKDTNVTANSLHPGAVHSDLQRHVSNFIRILTTPFQWVIFKDTLAGAQTQIRLAVDPSLEKVTGKYFSDCEEKSPLFTAKNDALAKWLWEKSEELTGLAIKEI